MFLNSITSKFLIAVSACAALILACAMLFALYEGIPSALSSVMLGTAPDSPFAAVGLVLAGWLAGFVASRNKGRLADGAMTKRHYLATAVFVSIFLALNHSLLGPDFLRDSGDAFIAALLIWLLVVIGPWASRIPGERPPDTSRDFK